MPAFCLLPQPVLSPSPIHPSCTKYLLINYYIPGLNIYPILAVRGLFTDK